MTADETLVGIDGSPSAPAAAAGQLRTADRPEQRVAPVISLITSIQTGQPGRWGYANHQTSNTAG